MAGIGEVHEGDDLAASIASAVAAGTALAEGDVLVVTQKIVSKAEGRLLDLAGVEPSAFARQFAAATARTRATWKSCCASRGAS